VVDGCNSICVCDHDWRGVRGSNSDGGYPGTGGAVHLLPANIWCDPYRLSNSALLLSAQYSKELGGKDGCTSSLGGDTMAYLYRKLSYVWDCLTLPFKMIYWRWFWKPVDYDDECAGCRLSDCRGCPMNVSDEE